MEREDHSSAPPLLSRAVALDMWVKCEQEWCVSLLGRDRETSVETFFFFLIWPPDMWDLSSLTSDWTCAPGYEAWNLNHWTTREILFFFFLSFSAGNGGGLKLRWKRQPIEAIYISRKSMEHSCAKTVPKPATNCIKEETDFIWDFFLFIVA